MEKKRISKNEILFFLGLFLFIMICIPGALAFTPEPGSPMARYEHPRLHITPETLPQLREIIKSNYAVEYQAYINDITANKSNGKNFLGTPSDEVLRALFLQQAFIGVLNISGFSYTITPDQFLRLAINYLIYEFNSTANKL